jgi:hypothetical protein
MAPGLLSHTVKLTISISPARAAANFKLLCCSSAYGAQEIKDTGLSRDLQLEIKEAVDQQAGAAHERP